MVRIISLLLVALLSNVVSADEDKVKELLDQVRKSIVKIKGADRWGETSGLGTGFVVGTNGVIASNFHVVGQNRAFTVEFPDGRTFRPTRILAVNRDRDLVLIEIDAENLEPLPLGDSDALNVGQSILTIGNPLRYEFSVGRGVIAAERDFEGYDMIQVAVPLEPGSSGSPIFDLEGRVLGILGIKTGGAMGLAVPINDLKRLMSNQRPVEMKHWVTIGALDEAEWDLVMGGEWRQRAGVLIASGTGSGFGGRMLALQKNKPPEVPYELEVEVKLEDESGAAGLAFHSDGGNTHYGFYPTAGSVRLTRFEGADVYSWTILDTVKTDAYKPGEWNTIRIAVEKNRLTGFVNGEQVISRQDDGLISGQIGLVKFRAPAAEFRRLRYGVSLESEVADEKLVAQIEKVIKRVASKSAVDGKSLSKLTAHGEVSIDLLEKRARELSEEVERVQSLAKQVHQEMVMKKLLELLVVEDDEHIDLLHAALQIARLDNPYLEIDPYRRRMDRIANQVKARFTEQDDEFTRVKKLLTHLFDELGFHGSSMDYYHRSNSYINEVIDDREGLPITLSLILIELANRLELPVYGVGIPRHFISMYRPDGKDVDVKLIDPFEGGKIISPLEASLQSGFSLTDEDFVPATKKSIILRMLQNLFAVAQQEQDVESMLRYADVLLAIDKDDFGTRGVRAMLLYTEGRYKHALVDLDFLMEQNPPGMDAITLDRLRQSIRERLSLE